MFVFVDVAPLSAAQGKVARMPMVCVWQQQLLSVSGLHTTERMFRYAYGSYDAIFGATSAIRAAAAVVLTIE